MPAVAADDRASGNEHGQGGSWCVMSTGVRGSQLRRSTAFAADTHRATGDSVRLTINHKPVTMRIAGEVFSPW